MSSDKREVPELPDPGFLLARILAARMGWLEIPLITLA